MAALTAITVVTLARRQRLKLSQSAAQSTDHSVLHGQPSVTHGHVDTNPFTNIAWWWGGFGSKTKFALIIAADLPEHSAGWSWGAFSSDQQYKILECLSGFAAIAELIRKNSEEYRSHFDLSGETQ